LGLPARLNQIIAESAGELLARMDADDAMHPRRLEKQVEIFQHNPSIDVVDTCAYIIDKEDKVVGKKRCEHADANNFYRALKWGIVLHPSVMAKKDWYVKNPYRLDYPRAEDRELFVRTIQDTKFYHIAEPLLFYRFEGNVRLNSYLQSYSSKRKVLMEYGPKLIGRTRTPCCTVDLWQNRRYYTCFLSLVLRTSLIKISMSLCLKLNVIMLKVFSTKFTIWSYHNQ